MKSYLCLLITGVLAALITPSESRQRNNIIFDRAEVTYSNPKYVKEWKLSLKRYNRTSPYIFNFNMTLMQPWGVNVTIQLRTFEFQNNQYKESIINTNEHVCHMIEDDKIVTEVLWKYSNLPKRCPMKDYFAITNYIMADGTFLPQIPPSRWRFNFNFYQNIKKEYMLKYEAFVQIKNREPKKRNKRNLI